MSLLLLLGLLAAAPEPALAPTESNRLTILCDSKAYRFSLRVGEASEPDETAYPQRTVVEPDSLIQMLPGWSGDLEVRGMLRRYVRCGPYTFRLEGDAYNAYIQGEMGAVEPFVAVSILYATRMIYYGPDGPVKFTECERGGPRANACPSGFALRLDGRYDAERRRVEMKEIASSTVTDEHAIKVERATRMIDYDADLSFWRGEQP